MSIYFQFRRLPLVLALQAVFAVPALAQFTVTSGTTDTNAKTLTGAAGVVQSNATLTTNSGTVTVTVAAGTSTITNSGTISQTVTARTINNSAAATLTITNNSGATISAAAADAIKIDNVGSRLTLTNEGSILVITSAFDSGQAIDMKKSFTGTSTITNGSVVGSAALIQSNGSDGIRIGSKTTVVNYGSIIGNGKTNTSSGSADGIDDDEKTQSGMVVSNYGIITGARHGITLKSNLLDATQTQITNYATGRIIGYNGSGVGSDGTGIVTNYGLISGRYAGEGNIFTSAGVASLNGDGDGVDIDGQGTVNNYGTIEGQNGGGVDSGGRPNGGDGVAMGGGTVNNYAGAVIWGKSNGILVDDGANGTDTVNPGANKNRGTTDGVPSVATITNSGTITGDRKVAIGLVGDWNDTITNNATGVITGGLDTQQVDKLSTDVTQTAGAAIQMGAGNDTLVNYGRIEGKNGLAIDMGAGDDTLKLFNGGSTGVVIGTIVGGTGTDTLETGGTQTFATGTVTGFERFIVRDGSTTFNYGLGAVTSAQIDSGATLQVNGALSTTGDFTVNGTFKASTDVAMRTITVGGNYAQGAAGVLEAGLGAANQSDTITTTGTGVVTDGATITPIHRAYATNGATYTLVSAGGGLTVTPANLVISNSAMVSHALSKVGGDLVLTATRASSVTSLAPVGLGALGSVLDGLGQGGSNAANSLLGALDTLPTAQAVGDALRQLLPESNGASQHASQQASGTIFSAFSSRIDAARTGLAMAPSGLAAGDSVNRRAWVQGVGASGEQDSRASENGYKTRATGIAGGIEVDRSAREVMGVSLGYTQAGSAGTGTGAGDNVRVDAMHVGGYLSQNDPGMTLDVAVVLGYNNYRSERAVVFSGFSEQLTGDYAGWQLGGRIEAGFPFAIAPQWSGRWLAGARASYSATNGYTESGSAAVAQQIDGASAKSLQSVLGIEFNHELATKSFLQFRTSYLHEFASSPSVSATMVAGGPSFTTAGGEPNREALQFGIGYRFLTKDGVTMTMGYDAEVKEKYLFHQLNARAVWLF